jgi:ornithine carbamoyltransferase
LTLEEHGVRLDSMRLAWLGDGNNVCHSLMELTALCGGSMVVATPPEFVPDRTVQADCARIASTTGARIEYSHDPAAVRGADAVYTDTWISMGQSHEAAKLAAMQPFQANPALMAVAGPNCLFMHCLPAHRGEEVVDAVIDGPRSVVFDQAENRMHAQNALLLLLLGVPTPNA